MSRGNGFRSMLAWVDQSLGVMTACPHLCRSLANLRAVQSSGYDEAQGFYFSLQYPRTR